MNISPTISRKFKVFISSKKGGARGTLKKITENKLNQLFNKWERHLQDVKYNLSSFEEWFSKSASNPKFKLPWMITDIEEAIEYCRSDLDSRNLKLEFERIRSNHYSRNI